MPGPPPHSRCRHGEPNRPLPLAEGLERRICLTTWYVAPTGSDIGFGTIDAPFGSLAGAASHARAGDTVLVHGGNYAPNSTQDLECLGAADGRITFQNYPGEKPVIDGGAMVDGSPVMRLGGQYLDFNGFEVRDAKGVGVIVTGQHLQLLDNTVDNSQRQGMLIGTGGGPDAVTDITVQGNSFTNNNLAPPPATSVPTLTAAASVPRPAALEAYGASAVRIGGNYVHENNSPGIETVGVVLGSVSTNVVHDNAVANILLDNSSNLTVARNFIYNTNETAYYTNGAPAISILLTNGSYGVDNPLDYVLIANNIALSSGGNLVYQNVRPASDPDPGLKDSIIANNDFYSGGGTRLANLQIDIVPGHSNNLVADNVFYQTNGTQVLFRTASGPVTNGVSPAGFTFEVNNWYNGGQSVLTQGGAPAVAGAGDVYSNPGFANVATIDPAGYEISPSSPDFDAGIPVAGVADDYYGIPRPQNKAPDIGAHEVVTTPPPPTPVPPPPGVAPGVPTGIAATAPSPYEIDLTWGDYWAPLAGFDVQLRGNGTWVHLGFAGAGPANATYASTGAFTETGLKPNHRYTYRIVAFFSDNTLSAYSKAFTFKTPPKPRPVKPAKPPKKPKAPKAVKVSRAVK